MFQKSDYLNKRPTAFSLHKAQKVVYSWMRQDPVSMELGFSLGHETSIWITITQSHITERLLWFKRQKVHPGWEKSWMGIWRKWYLGWDLEGEHDFDLQGRSVRGHLWWRDYHKQKHRNRKKHGACLRHRKESRFPAESPGVGGEELWWTLCNIFNMRMKCLYSMLYAMEISKGFWRQGLRS